MVLDRCCCVCMHPKAQASSIFKMEPKATHEMEFLRARHSLKKTKNKKLFYTMWNKLKQGSIILTFPSQLSFLTLLLLVNLEMYPELVNSLVSLASLCLPCLDHSLKFQVTCLRSTNTFTCLPEYSIAKAQIFHFYQHLIPSLCLNFPRLFI